MTPHRTIRMRIFEHTQGRFVFPAMGYAVEDGCPCDLDIDAMMWAVNTGTRDTGEFFECPSCNGRPYGFEGVRATITGPMFAHGGGDVIFISGPLLDAHLPPADGTPPGEGRT